MAVIGGFTLSGILVLLVLPSFPRLVDAETAVLSAPPVVGLLRDAELPANLTCRLAAGQLDFGLTQLRNDLLGAVSLPPHRAPPSPPRASIVHAGAV
jgi:hypothetical protein